MSGTFSCYNFGIYQCWVLAAIFYLILTISWRTFFQNVFEDIPNDTKIISAGHIPSVMLLVIDAAFLAIFCSVACVQLLFRKWKHEIVSFFNSVVEIDDSLEGNEICKRNLLNLKKTVV